MFMRYQILKFLVILVNAGLFVLFVVGTPMLIGLVVHPTTWLGHRAKGLVGLGFDTQCRRGPGWFFGFSK